MEQLVYTCQVRNGWKWRWFSAYYTGNLRAQWIPLPNLDKESCFHQVFSVHLKELSHFPLWMLLYFFFPFTKSRLAKLVLLGSLFLTPSDLLSLCPQCLELLTCQVYQLWVFLFVNCRRHVTKPTVTWRDPWTNIWLLWDLLALLHARVSQPPEKLKWAVIHW